MTGFEALPLDRVCKNGGDGQQQVDWDGGDFRCNPFADRVPDHVEISVNSAVFAAEQGVTVGEVA